MLTAIQLLLEHLSEVDKHQLYLALSKEPQLAMMVATDIVHVPSEAQKYVAERLTKIEASLYQEITTLGYQLSKLSDERDAQRFKADTLREQLHREHYVSKVRLEMVDARDAKIKRALEFETVTLIKEALK